MNEKKYVNGVECNSTTQTSTTEEVLRAKNARMHKKIQTGGKIIDVLLKMVIAMMVVCVGLLISLIVMNNRKNALEDQYETLNTTYQNVLHNYTELSVDYAQLKDDLDSIGEMFDNGEDYTAEVLYQSAVVKYSSFPGGFNYNAGIPLDEDLQRYAYTKCIENDIDYSVFLGLMRHESTFDPDAISKSSDYGLCQINVSNHSWMREVFGTNWDPMNPYDSIDASIYMLNTLINSYSDVNTYHKLLMSYNFGHGGASKHFANGTYSSAYSRQIMEYAEEYGYSGDGTI